MRRAPAAALGVVVAASLGFPLLSWLQPESASVLSVAAPASARSATGADDADDADDAAATSRSLRAPVASWAATYSIGLEQRLLLGSATGFSLRSRGTLRCVALPAPAGARRERWTFEWSSQELGSAPPLVQERLRGLARVRLELRRTRTGRVTGVALPVALSPARRNVVRGWVASLQWVHEAPARRAWTASAYDPAGAREDRYRRLGRQGDLEWVERTRRYLAPASGQAAPVLARGAARLSFRGQELHAFASEEVLALGARAEFALDERWALTRIASEANAEPEEAEALLPWEALAQTEVEAGTEFPSARSSEALLADFVLDPDAHFFALARGLARDAGLRERLLALIRDRSVPLEARRASISALGAALAQESELQGVALELVEDERLEAPLVSNAYLALAKVGSPNSETLEHFLSALAQGSGERADWAIQGAGLLAAGAESPAAQALLSRALERRLREASGESAALLLSALGNASSESSFGLIAERVDAEEVSVRAAAAEALRTSPHADALELLGVLARDDRDRRVREAALRALVDRDPVEALPFARAALRDRDPHVRLEAVRTLGAWSGDEDYRADPSLLADVQQALDVALGDAHAQVREFAARALAEGPG